MNAKIFKAYDIRGVYPFEINEEVVSSIAEKLPTLLKLKKRVVIGHDIRLSSLSLYHALKEGLQATGKLEVIDAGLMTTPMLYFLVNELKAGGGAMVTASHNPKEFNGLKIVGPQAIPISGEEMRKVVGIR